MPDDPVPDPLSPRDVVTSRHLAAGALPALSEMELAMIMCMNTFHRWITRCMTAAGGPPMSPLEIIILHNVNGRDTPRKFADICLMLGIEDIHQARYAIRKLDEAGLVTTGKLGKEKTVQATDLGERICNNYKDIRERLLIHSAREAASCSDLSHLARSLRALSGAYDQATRSAASW